MPNYRRSKIAGGTYFMTQGTDQRQPWLCQDIARHAFGSLPKIDSSASQQVGWTMPILLSL